MEILSGKDKGKQGKVSQVIRRRNWVILEGLNTVGVKRVFYKTPFVMVLSKSSTFNCFKHNFFQHYRYVGRSGDYRGTYIASEAPLLLKDVMLIDPTDRWALMLSSGASNIKWSRIVEWTHLTLNVLCLMFLRKPTDIEWRYTEEGERVRVSVRTGRIIPKPVYQRKDGIIPQQWKGGASEEGGWKIKKNNAFVPRVLDTQIFKCGVFLYLADGPKDTSPDDALQKTYMPSLKTLEEEVMEKLNIQEDRKPRKSYWYWCIVFEQDYLSWRNNVCSADFVNKTTKCYTRVIWFYTTNTCYQPRHRLIFWTNGLNVFGSVKARMC